MVQDSEYTQSNDCRFLAYKSPWEFTPTPFQPNTITKLQCTLLLSGQIHSPCFISTNICTLWFRILLYHCWYSTLRGFGWPDRPGSSRQVWGISSFQYQLHVHSRALPHLYKVHSRALPHLYQVHSRALSHLYQVHSRALPHLYHVNCRALPYLYQVNSRALPHLYQVNTRALPHLYQVNSRALPHLYQVNSRALPHLYKVNTRALPQLYHVCRAEL